MVKQDSRNVRRRTAAILIGAAATAAGFNQLMLPGGAMAGTFTWANTNITFNGATAWIGGVAPANSNADVAVFQGVPSAQPLITNATRTIGAIDLQSSGWVFTGSAAANRIQFGTGVDQGGGVFFSGINSTTNPTGTALFNTGINLSNQPVNFNYSLDITFAGLFESDGTTARVLNFNGSGNTSISTLNIASGATTISRTFTIGGTGTGLIAINGPVITSAGSSGTLAVDGSVTVDLVNAGNTQFQTKLNGGTTRIHSDGSLGANPASAVANNVNVTGTATLQVAAGAGTVSLGANRGITMSGLGTRTFFVDTNGAGNTLVVNSPIVQAGGTSGTLTKQGAGTLVLTQTNTLTGAALAVNAGTVKVATSGANSATTNVATLSIAGGPAAPTATLDLSDNDAIFTATPRANIQSMINFARNGAAWNQPGITSSSAAAATPKNTTLGVLSGAEFLVVASGGPFDGVTVNAGDVLVKYTWYGDTDFNGVVNFDDYSRTDSGFNNGRSGWLNGDFDGSGQVDFDDYSLIDLAFNTQSGTLRRATTYLGGANPPTGVLNAVPEPTGALVFSGLAALAAGKRRYRRRDKH